MNLLSMFALSTTDEVKHFVFSLKDAWECIVYLFHLPSDGELKDRYVSAFLFPIEKTLCEISI